MQSMRKGLKNTYRLSRKDREVQRQDMAWREGEQGEQERGCPWLRDGWRRSLRGKMAGPQPREVRKDTRSASRNDGLCKHCARRIGDLTGPVTLTRTHLGEMDLDTHVSEISTSVRKALAKVLGDSWGKLCETLAIPEDVMEKVGEARAPLMSFLALWEDGQFTQQRLPTLRDLLDALRKAYGDEYVQDRMGDVFKISIPRLVPEAGAAEEAASEPTASTSPPASDITMSSSQFPENFFLRNLPSKYFTGRTRELEELKVALSQPCKRTGVRCVMLRFPLNLRVPAGFGCRELVAQYALNNKDMYPGGMFYIGFAVYEVLLADLFRISELQSHFLTGGPCNLSRELTMDEGAVAVNTLLHMRSHQKRILLCVYLPQRLDRTTEGLEFALTQIVDSITELQAPSGLGEIDIIFVSSYSNSVARAMMEPRKRIISVIEVNSPDDDSAAILFYRIFHDIQTSRKSDDEVLADIDALSKPERTALKALAHSGAKKLEVTCASHPEVIKVLAHGARKAGHTSFTAAFAAIRKVVILPADAPRTSVERLTFAFENTQFVFMNIASLEAIRLLRYMASACSLHALIEPEITALCESSSNCKVPARAKSKLTGHALFRSLFLDEICEKLGFGCITWRATVGAQGALRLQPAFYISSALRLPMFSLQDTFFPGLKWSELAAGADVCDSLSAVYIPVLEDWCYSPSIPLPSAMDASYVFEWLMYSEISRDKTVRETLRFVPPPRPQDLVSVYVGTFLRTCCSLENDSSPEDFLEQRPFDEDTMSSDSSLVEETYAVAPNEASRLLEAIKEMNSEEVIAYVVVLLAKVIRKHPDSNLAHCALLEKLAIAFEDALSHLQCQMTVLRIFGLENGKRVMDPKFGPIGRSLVLKTYTALVISTYGLGLLEDCLRFGRLAIAACYFIPNKSPDTAQRMFVALFYMASCNPADRIDDALYCANRAIEMSNLYGPFAPGLHSIVETPSRISETFHIRRVQQEAYIVKGDYQKALELILQAFVDFDELVEEFRTLHLDTSVIEASRDLMLTSLSSLAVLGRDPEVIKLTTKYINRNPEYARANEEMGMFTPTGLGRQTRSDAFYQSRLRVDALEFLRTSAVFPVPEEVSVRTLDEARSQPNTAFEETWAAILCRSGLRKPSSNAAVCCAVCGSTRSALKACSRCRRVSYCSVACQRADWKTHKGKCEGE